MRLGFLSMGRDRASMPDVARLIGISMGHSHHKAPINILRSI